ncbi:hypothetical protein M6B38_361580 [Iris pallida]|uniref:Uncharacterized protein n=1 Tax=Iris pallida TaxID=29817 RepID=A0AAX6GKJ8_IRIPA|nr:hypothetical protein M6B38_361580 [Iris pallida]
MSSQLFVSGQILLCPQHSVVSSAPFFVSTSSPSCPGSDPRCVHHFIIFP